MSTWRNEDGLTMMELIVAMVVSGLFLGFLAVLFANGVQAQAQATERDLATGRAGVVSNSILTSVRYSSGFVVVSGNRALIAKVVDSTGAPICRAWLVLAPGDADYRRDVGDAPYLTGDLIYKESASTILLSDRTGWSRLIDRGSASGDGTTGAMRVRSGSHADGSPRFVNVDVDGDGRADAFGRSGSTLSVGLDVTLGDATVSITNGVTTQAKSSGTDTTTCW
ncbi:UNVERIFIED_CONTAM: type II secretion system GspH family protein [Microbacterium sp. SLM126]